MTFLPPRSAACATVSADSMPGSNAAVRLANGSLCLWKVLLVEPCTPGQAPVAIVYQPAPVFGGAWVSMPPLSADAPRRSMSAKAGTLRSAAYRSTMSCRSPSAANSSTGSDLCRSGWLCGVADAGSTTAVDASRAAATASTTRDRLGRA
jgi:hypothetical protein